MNIALGSNVRYLILTVTFFAGLGFGTHASADQRPYLIDLNSKTAAGFGSLGGGNTGVADLNDFGQVVGTSRTAAGADHAFITGPNGKG